MSSLDYETAFPGHDEDLDEVQLTLRQEHLLLKKKASMLASGKLDEEKSEKLTIKLEPTLKELYQKAPEEVKAFARKAMRIALMSAVFSYWLEDWKPSGSENRGDCNVTINITVNEAAHNKRCADTKIIEEIQTVIEELKRLKKILDSSQAAPLQRDIVGNVLGKLNKLLSV